MSKDPEPENQARMPTPIQPGGQRRAVSARDEIMEDINSREQRLLEKLAILRCLRRLVDCSTLDQVEKILEVHRMESQLYWLKD